MEKWIDLVSIRIRDTDISVMVDQCVPLVDRRQYYPWTGKKVCNLNDLHTPDLHMSSTFICLYVARGSIFAVVT